MHQEGVDASIELYQSQAIQRNVVRHEMRCVIDAAWCAVSSSRAPSSLKTHRARTRGRADDRRSSDRSPELAMDLSATSWEAVASSHVANVTSARPCYYSKMCS